MTLPLFPSPDASRLRARRISANALCGPSCPELSWSRVAHTPSAVCLLFGATLAVGDGRARRCRSCLEGSNP